MRRRLRVVSQACALLFSALAAGACSESPETPLAGRDLLEMRSDMVGYDTNTFVVNSDGIRAAKIHSDTAYYFQDSAVVHMDGVQMEIYVDQGPTTGAVKATVTALRGRYDPHTQGMHAEGNVVLIMPTEGRRVESGELDYEPSDQRISSDSASTYTYQGRVTRGTCFKSDMSFKNYTVCNIRGNADVGGAGTGG